MRLSITLFFLGAVAAHGTCLPALNPLAPLLSAELRIAWEPRLATAEDLESRRRARGLNPDEQKCLEQMRKDLALLLRWSPAQWLADADFRVWLARKAAFEGRYAEADAALAEALKLSPDHPEALFLRARMTLSQGKDVEAAPLLRRLIELPEEKLDKAIRINVIEMALESQIASPAEVLAWSRRWLSLDPESPTALSFLFVEAMEAKRSDLLSEVMGTLSEPGRTLVFAGVQFLGQKYAEAAVGFAKYLEHPKSEYNLKEFINIRLAEIDVATGQIDAALQKLMALSEGERNQEISKLLTQIADGPGFASEEQALLAVKIDPLNGSLYRSLLSKMFLPGFIGTGSFPDARLKATRGYINKWISFDSRDPWAKYFEARVLFERKVFSSVDLSLGPLIEMKRKNGLRDSRLWADVLELAMRNKLAQGDLAAAQDLFAQFEGTVDDASTRDRLRKLIAKGS